LQAISQKRFFVSLELDELAMFVEPDIK